jgi:hypothetical protein
MSFVKRRASLAAMATLIGFGSILLVSSGNAQQTQPNNTPSSRSMPVQPAQTPETQASQAAPSNGTGQGVACDVYLDTSGSMKGFYAPGAPRADLDRLQSAFMEQCGRLTTFSTGSDPVRTSFPPDLVFRGDTDLHNALKTWLDLGTNTQEQRRVIIITDNVASPGAGAANSGEEAQQKFYGLLSSPESRLSHISVLLMRRSFSGPVYGQDGRTGSQYPAGGGAAPRALSVYLIEQNGDRDDDSMFQNFSAPLKQRFGSDSLVDASDLAGAVNGEKNIVRLRLKPFTPVVRDTQARPPIRLTSTGQGLTELKAKTDAAPAFRYNLSSRQSGEIKGEGEIQWTESWSLKKSPLKVVWQARPSDAELAKKVFLDQIPCTVSPDSLEFPPGDAAARKVTFNFSCPLVSRVGQLSKSELSALAAKQSNQLDGDVRFIIEVSAASDLELQGPVKAQFALPDGSNLGSATPEIQGRINGLSGLLVNMIPVSERAVTVNALPLAVRFVLPPELMFQIFIGQYWLPFLVISLIFLALLWQFLTVYKYRVTGSELSEQSIPMRPFSAREVRIPNLGLVKIWRVAGLLFVTGALGSQKVRLGEQIIKKVKAITPPRPPGGKRPGSRPQRPAAATSTTNGDPNSGAWLRLDLLRGSSARTTRKPAAGSARRAGRPPGPKRA